MRADPPPVPGDGSLRVDQYEKLLLANGAGFCVRLMVSYASLCDGDLTSTTVFLSIALAGTQHLRNRSVDTDDFEGPYYRDSRRRHVSISSIARSLDLPTETVRRKCVRLAELDLVERASNGRVMVTSRILSRPEVDAVVQDGVAAMNMLMHQIGKAMAETPRARPLPESRPV